MSKKRSLRRDKRSRGRLPESAIRWILDSNDLSIDDIEYVVTHGKSWNIGYSNILMEFLKVDLVDSQKT